MARLFMKNVIKNLVKECQRRLDYKSPFGVKFWNQILRDTKNIDTKKRKKVRKENIKAAIDRDVAYWTRCIEDKTFDSAKKEKFKIYLELIEPFLSEDWRYLIDMETRRPLKWDERKWFNERIGDYQTYYVFKPKKGGKFE